MRQLLPQEMLEDVARRFRALGEPLRLRILSLLTQKDRSVNEIAAALDAGQSNISRHLQALYDCGMVSRRREGNAIYYAIADPMITKLCDLVCSNARRHAESKLARLTGRPTYRKKA